MSVAEEVLKWKSVVLGNVQQVRHVTFLHIRFSAMFLVSVPVYC